ncbi:MAG: hypothetical protein WCF36_19100 [Candidatus Nanopelagicales bacterium]
MTLRLPKASPRVSGKPDGYRDLREAVTLAQRYVDGRTRNTPLDVNSIDAVLFRPPGPRSGRSSRRNPSPSTW